MKIRFFYAIIIFVSAYSPLSIIFLIQDFNVSEKRFDNPYIVLPIAIVSFICVLLTLLAVRGLKSSDRAMTIKSVQNRSGELLNYCIPYMISFFALDLSNIKILLNFSFFMLILFWLTYKTHNIFINPVLTVMGYRLYDVKYKKADHEMQDYMLCKERLYVNDFCRAEKLSDHLLLITEINPRE